MLTLNSVVYNAEIDKLTTVSKLFEDSLLDADSMFLLGWNIIWHYVGEL